MASFQLRSSPSRTPTILGEAQRSEVLAFLSEDTALNMFQLCWLDNHGVAARGRPELYHFAGLRGGSGDLEGVTLVIGERLLLVHALHREAAATLGRWYRRRGVVLEHVVSGRASVTPFWAAYRDAQASPPVRARLDREQIHYVLDRDHWREHVYPPRRRRFEPTDVRLARVDEIESIFLASAQMHLEETLENPLDTEPDAFRKHVRHRIQSGRSFAWFDQNRRLIFKADISASSSFGAQISGVYTPPRFRGRGVATRALFDICEELFESGLPCVTLYVNAGNKAAHRVYQKVGFEAHADYQTVFVESSFAESSLVE